MAQAGLNKEYVCSLLVVGFSSCGGPDQAEMIVLLLPTFGGILELKGPISGLQNSTLTPHVWLDSRAIWGLYEVSFLHIFSNFGPSKKGQLFLTTP